MRLQFAIQQHHVTATVLSATIAILTLLHVTIVNAADASNVEVGTRNNLNIREANIDAGTGLPFSLDSFNGLEIKDRGTVDVESTGRELARRYPIGATSLANNEYQKGTIKVGGVQWWYVTKEVVNGQHDSKGSGLPDYLDADGQVVSSDITHELRKRDNNLYRRSSTVYLSLTTCGKPTSNHSEMAGSFPQLELYVSQTLEEPGPGKEDSQQSVVTASGGYLSYELEADGDVYIGVAASNSTTWSGYYTYQIAASIDAYFHSVVDEPFLYFVDSDQSAALLVTNNLTQSDPGSANYQQWMNLTPPYTVFAHNINDTALAGLERSFCALDELSQVGHISNSVEAGMTSRGLGNKPKEQFYITGLNKSSVYNGILAMIGNSTSSENGVVGGGGTVWKAMNFTTKTGMCFPHHTISILSLGLS